MMFVENIVKKYIRENLSKFHDRIHVCQMLDHLPCLTEMDKQQIRAYVDRNGNNVSVCLFFEHLQRRRNWVQQLLRALHETNLGDLAEDIQRVYDANQVRPPSRPSAPPAPLGADVSRAAVPAREDSNNPPSDVCQRSPRNDSMPGRVSPPLSGDPPRPAFSTSDQSVQHMGDCSTPVQETKHPSSSHDTVVTPKNTGNARMPESATPVQEKSEASPGMSLQVHKGDGGDGVTLADITSRRSPNQSLRGMPREGLLLTTPANSRSNAGPQQTVSPDPRTSDNQPEENDYSSSTSSLSTPRGQDEPQERQSPDLHIHSTIPCQSPVQVSDPSKQETTPKQGKEEVTQPNRNNAPGSSRTHRIYDTNEEDYAPPKPGVLTSHLGEIPKLGDEMLNSHTTNPAYSGDSGRLRLSESSGNDPLMVTQPNRNNAPGSSRTHCIDDTNEEDYAPPKPGVLTSPPGEIPKLGDEMLNSHTTNRAYSGNSDSLQLSEYSGNDSLMVSEPSQNGLSEERCSGPANWDRRKTTARTYPAQPGNENHLDDGFVTILRGTILQPPSFDLTGAADEDPDVPTTRFRGPVPDSALDQPINGASSYPKNSDDAHPNKKAKDAKPSPWGNPVWPAVGLALAFGVLALLRWLRK